MRLRAAATVALLVFAAACHADVPKETEARERRTASLDAAVAAAKPARAPFEGLSANAFVVGDKPYDLVIADTEPERIEGLRGRATTSPYDGMLFVFSGEQTAQFTMADTIAPLEIAFYANDGSLVSRASMTPCTTGDDSSCPRYSAAKPYRWAVETPGGQPVPDGLLRGR